MLRPVPTTLCVFDWDGTLADSQTKIVDCLRRSFARLGAEPLDDARLASIIGLGLPEAARDLYPGCDDAFVSGFVQHYRDLWLAPESPPARLFSGVPEVLAAVRERGIVMAVATGKSRRGLDRELDETGLGDFFASTRCADETCSKPDPQMLLELLKVTDMPAAQALMIGDSHWDLRMAAAANVRSVAVSYGAQPIEQLRAHGPAACIDQLDELLSLL